MSYVINEVALSKVNGYFAICGRFFEDSENREERERRKKINEKVSRMS
jgi:hypothetical protein